MTFLPQLPNNISTKCLWIGDGWLDHKETRGEVALQLATVGPMAPGPRQGALLNIPACTIACCASEGKYALSNFSLVSFLMTWGSLLFLNWAFWNKELVLIWFKLSQFITLPLCLKSVKESSKEPHVIKSKIGEIFLLFSRPTYNKMTTMFTTGLRWLSVI